METTVTCPRQPTFVERSLWRICDWLATMTIPSIPPMIPSTYLVEVSNPQLSTTMSVICHYWARRPAVEWCPSRPWLPQLQAILRLTEVEARNEAGTAKKLKTRLTGRGGGKTMKLPRDHVTPVVPKKMKLPSGPPSSNRRIWNCALNWPILKTRRPNCVVWFTTVRQYCLNGLECRVTNFIIFQKRSFTGEKYFSSVKTTKFNKIVISVCN